MTIPTRLGLKRQQMSNEISYKPGKYLTKHLVPFAIVFVISLLIIISNISRFVNPTFEEQIIKKVSTTKVKLYDFKHQRRSSSSMVKLKETKNENIKPEKVNRQKSKTEKAKPKQVKPKQVKPEKANPEKANPEKAKTKQTKAKKVMSEKPKPEKIKKVTQEDSEPEKVKPEIWKDGITLITQKLGK